MRLLQLPVAVRPLLEFVIDVFVCAALQYVQKGNNLQSRSTETLIVLLGCCNTAEVGGGFCIEQWKQSVWLNCALEWQPTGSFKIHFKGGSCRCHSPCRGPSLPPSPLFPVWCKNKLSDAINLSVSTASCLEQSVAGQGVFCGAL